MTFPIMPTMGWMRSSASRSECSIVRVAEALASIKPAEVLMEEGQPRPQPQPQPVQLRTRLLETTNPPDRPCLKSCSGVSIIVFGIVSAIFLCRSIPPITKLTLTSWIDVSPFLIVALLTAFIVTTGGGALLAETLTGA